MQKWSTPRAVIGTRPRQLSGAVFHALAAPLGVVEVTLVLRPEERPDDHPSSVRRREVDESHPRQRIPLTIEELAEVNAPSGEHVDLVRDFASDHGLDVVEVSATRHDVLLRGSVEALDRAFGVRQGLFAHPGGHYRAHEDEIALPPELAQVVHSVFGLDEIPRRRSQHVPASSGPSTMSIPDIVRHYDFPVVDGTPPRVAVLESGGYHPSDLDAFFGGLGVSVPVIRDVCIADSSGNAAKNEPLAEDVLGAMAKAWTLTASFRELGEAAKEALEAKGQLPEDRDEAKKLLMATIGAFTETAEVTMDIQVLGGIVPTAEMDVYFTDMSADGWRRAIYAMLGAPYGGDEAQPMPAVLSISWGESESGWGGVRQVEAIHHALQAAGRRGMTVCCSSGDWGSRNTSAPAKAEPGQSPVPGHNVNFPASSPSVLACGGTLIAGTGDSAWKETVLGKLMASGGGMSGLFPRPAYQGDLKTPEPADTWLADGGDSFGGRWIPDVAANAAFESGVELVMGGEPYAGGGTSAATPIWAGLMAMVAAAMGKPLGPVSAAFYGLHQGLRDVAEGDNDVSGTEPAAYPATEGWDPCTGLGVPDGSSLLKSFMEHHED